MKTENKDFVLEYHKESAFQLLFRKIRLYSDGVVEIFQGNVDKKELRIPAQQVIAYAEKLNDAGFFDLKDRYYSLRGLSDGVDEYVTLNYGGRSKKVVCESVRPNLSEFEQVIGELHRLMQQSE